MQQAQVFRNDILAGLLTKEDNGTYTFIYDANYLQRDDAKNIAIAFPLQRDPFTSSYLFPFFFNMLSEGGIKKTQCHTLKIDEDDHFTRLIKTAYADTIGSIKIKEVEL
ncbi:MAG: HipA N-terminal domain-containing protein [Sulfurimonas sp.]|jgi:serine/threonine-protein kinase HipA|uniref:HipA N-terminal domain-containing protein n=1 Tax=Sulfurimonas sp. TaxID=2022749 RepID=UPI00262BA8CC|nr:HipA N-terminal domain-containing protein [Sulfurimonas sp.]MDD3476304.1 HipA N-terminal domain-containing protein [Sulfurimonas sp.]